MQRSKIFDKFGKKLTGLSFSFSFLDSFLLYWFDIWHVSVRFEITHSLTGRIFSEIRPY